MYDALHYVDYLHIQNLYAVRTPVGAGAQFGAGAILGCISAVQPVKRFRCGVDA